MALMIYLAIIFAVMMAIGLLVAMLVSFAVSAALSAGVSAAVTTSETRARRRSWPARLALGLVPATLLGCVFALMFYSGFDVADRRILFSRIHEIRFFGEAALVNGAIVYALWLAALIFRRSFTLYALASAAIVFVTSIWPAALLRGSFAYDIPPAIAALKVVTAAEFSLWQVRPFWGAVLVALHFLLTYYLAWSFAVRDTSQTHLRADTLIIGGVLTVTALSIAAGFGLFSAPFK